MPVVVTMPKLTDSMEEGRIVEWLVRVGDKVAEGDILAEIETDKAVMELESFASGVVAEILHQDGAVVPVGEPIARIREAGEAEETKPTQTVREEPPPQPADDAAAKPDVPKTVPEPSKPEAPLPPEPAAAPRPAPEGVSASPRARKLAGERGIDIVGLKGTGPDGRVTVEDVEAATDSQTPAQPPESAEQAESPRSPQPSAQAPDQVEAERAATVLAAQRGVNLATLIGTGLGGRITVADVLSAAPKVSAGPETRSAPADRADEELPAVTFSPEEAEAEEVTFYQKAAIRRVVASKHVIPHFYLTKMVHADALLELQQKEKHGSGATLTHFLMRACALALENHPEANRSYDRGRWIRWKVIHLGLAIQTDAGLVVGVLREAGEKDLGWIAENTKSLVERARQGKLRAPERTNPTFTISNLGAFDVESFSAIINPPSAMTLAVGSVVPAPVVKDGEVKVGQLMHLTLSVDHRVVDGVLAARFLGEVKDLLEEPEKLR